MAGYITGMTIGSFVLLIGLYFLISYLWKKRSHYKNIKEIGRSAELKINGDLYTWSRQTKNLFLDSSYFLYKQNKVFEVDSILLTDRALYVIEIKSIKGIIKGDAQKSSWIKKLGEQEFPITNPIVQNDRHIEHILKMTNTKIPTISLIIYSNRADYLNVTNIPSYVALIKHSQLFDTLDSIERSLPPKFNSHEKQLIMNKIKSFKTSKRKDINLHKKITRQGTGK